MICWLSGGPETSGAMGISVHNRLPPGEIGRDTAVPMAHFVVGVGNIAVVHTPGLK